MSNKFNEIHSCEVCGKEHLVSVLNLGFHPMCDDLVQFGSSRACNEYPIEILFCKTCNTAHQRFQVPKEDLFPTTYHYRSRFTADVLNGMSNLVASCAQRFAGLTGKKVLDIGCNDGSLLDFFKKEGAVTFGIEPTGAYLDAEKKGHVTYNEYLSEEVAQRFVEKHGQPDIITFTNVFAHIEDLKGVLRAVRKLMSQTTKLVIENHYLGAVLDGNQFDTFYHEHPRTYSYTSFAYMAHTLRTQLMDVEFPSRYGGNIRVFMGDMNVGGSSGQVDLAALSLREGQFFNAFATMRSNVLSWQGTKKELIDSLFQKYGKLRAKAFPGRSAILVKLLGLDESKIEAVYEKPGSLKIGNYVPGTRIPIRSDDELFALSDQTLPIVNLAWHIPQEIRKYLAEKNYTGRVVDILSAEDFK